MARTHSIALAPVSRRALPLDTVALAKSLLGCILVRRMSAKVMTARIVETEAYLHAEDAASHAFRGQTPRNRAMFLARGHAYVYFIYGNSFMLNVSSGPEGVGAGVLIRGAEPLRGLDHMARNRGLDDPKPEELTRGPGRLAQALAIDRALDGVDLCARGPLWIARAEPAGEIATSPRIGITKNAEPLLRFFIKDSRFVSRGKFWTPG